MNGIFGGLFGLELTRLRSSNYLGYCKDWFRPVGEYEQFIKEAVIYSNQKAIKCQSLCLLSLLAERK